MRTISAWPLVPGVIGVLTAAALAGVSLLGLGGARAQDQAASQSAGAAQVSLADLVHAAKLYEERCSGCHDHPSGRIPPRAVIADHPPGFIFDALSKGVMKPQAAGLSETEMRAIAAYLSPRRREAAPAGPEAPPCTGKPKPLSLAGPQWNGWGRDLGASRYQPQPRLKPADVPRLKVKWVFGYAGSRHGQPTVVGGRLFLTSTSGAIYSLDARSGCVYWRFEADAGARTTVTVGALPPGAPARFAAYFSDYGRTAYALDAETGRLIWKTRVDDEPVAILTGSPTLYAGRLYVPISSAEEAVATNDEYECCRFRGALVALDAVTGKLLWKTYTVPEPPHPFKKNAMGVQMYGPAGGAIWSAPTVDPKRHLVYVGTGDSYTDLDFVGSDSVFALDMDTGAIRWVNQLTKGDTYIIGCYPPRRVANCPTRTGGDYDIGSSPILHTLPNGRQLLLIGQKSSQVYALDPDHDGHVVWERRLSPGGPLGGVEFGPAADRDNIYVPIADIFLGAAGRPGLSALGIPDGKLLWTTPSAPLPCRWTNLFCSPALSQAVSVIPGVVFAGAMNGHLRAYSTRTGQVIWDFDTAAQPYRILSGGTAQGGVLDAGGPVIVDGMLYVHSGYAGRSGADSILIAFSVDGR